jgi:A/G-specific adenine glycosylase
MAKAKKSSEGFDSTGSDSLKSVLPRRLLEWYDAFGRDLPWRTRGAHPNPYFVWVSEIMLQQTTVKTVIPYFHRFLKKFPDIHALASANIEDVLFIWQGLGYYTRAKKMHECAQYLVKNNGGIFPEMYNDLLKLPGIGPYTAASISSLAFDKQEAVVDGNVIRVISRLYAVRESTSESLPEITKKARLLMPKKRAADYTSAIMDLGATVCTPKNPLCGECPFSKHCAALKENAVNEIPKIIKIQKVKKSGALYWIENEAGAVYIQKRTEKGLLCGLTEFLWHAEEDTGAHKSPTFPIQSDWENTGKSVQHVFTHIVLHLDIYKTKVNEADFLKRFTGEFVMPKNFSAYPFSTLMKKVIREMEQSKTGTKSKTKKTKVKDLTQF